MTNGSAIALVVVALLVVVVLAVLGGQATGLLGDGSAPAPFPTVPAGHPVLLLNLEFTGNPELPVVRQSWQVANMYGPKLGSQPGPWKLELSLADGSRRHYGLPSPARVEALDAIGTAEATAVPDLSQFTWQLAIPLYDAGELLLVTGATVYDEEFRPLFSFDFSATSPGSIGAISPAATPAATLSPADWGVPSGRTEGSEGTPTPTTTPATAPFG
jgi:hypothetical protein